jgi:hypothetical protein
MPEWAKAFDGTEDASEMPEWAKAFDETENAKMKMENEKSAASRADFTKFGEEAGAASLPPMFQNQDKIQTARIVPPMKGSSKLYSEYLRSLPIHQSARASPSAGADKPRPAKASATASSAASSAASSSAATDPNKRKLPSWEASTKGVKRPANAPAERPALQHETQYKVALSHSPPPHWRESERQRANESLALPEIHDYNPRLKKVMSAYTILQTDTDDVFKITQLSTSGEIVKSLLIAPMAIANVNKFVNVNKQDDLKNFKMTRVQIHDLKILDDSQAMVLGKVLGKDIKSQHWIVFDVNRICKIEYTESSKYLRSVTLRLKGAADSIAR